ncbi:MAG TPA: hypothetical protein VEP67_03245, partial [Thiobacillaceae bacterium]|nr:hypothetical protein [Thiobacillaceae bacterium]
RFGLPQKPNDLLFRKTLLHVQSPSFMGLDSKARHYSIRGDVGAAILTAQGKSGFVAVSSFGSSVWQLPLQLAV